MQYSKGDTIKFKDDTLIIVLNDGIKGREFVDRYQGQAVPLMSSWAVVQNFKVDEQCYYKASKISKSEYVWYRILVGDKHFWIANSALYYRINHYWPEEENAVQ